MRISESCAKCLYDKQVRMFNDEEYLYRVREIINNRKDTDTTPYLVYLFNRLYEEMFGLPKSFSNIKRKYNDLILDLENEIRSIIESSNDPLGTSLQYARIGNYIDFGAMNSVDEKEFPYIDVTVLVRGGEVLNDATVEDAEYSGIHHIARIIDNGLCIAGTVYDLLPEEAKEYLDYTDVILAKGQGNYESLSGNGRHIFYSFLCKCDLFINRFQVPKLTGIFVEE